MTRFGPEPKESYVFWIRRYGLFHGRRHPRHLGPPEVRKFRSALATHDRVAAWTQNQALAALTFLYERVLRIPLPRIEGIVPARRARHVPIVLSRREMRSVLARLDDPVRLCARLMYGSGLGLLECPTLRVKDLDFDRREIVVRGGKSGNDRRTPLPATSVAGLRAWLRAGRRQFEVDRRAGVRCTGIPPGVLRKYPHADRDRCDATAG